MKRQLLILIGLWAMAYGLWAMDNEATKQETIIVGDIYDAYTGEPLPNVNIYFQGTPLGTMSNPEGMFLLRGHIDRPRTMVVSAVGYHSERFRIEAGQQVGIEVALKEKVGSIGDVFVYPGVNPAIPLMEQVRRHRHTNSQLSNNNSSDSEIKTHNSQLSLYVSDIQSKHLQRNLWKSLQKGMLQAEDSTYLIPLYWRKQQAEKVEEQATLLTLTDYHILLNQLQSTCNFYHNNVNVLSASLLSPLAASGNSYYHYYLVDSCYVNQEKHYLVHFRTKNAFNATFNGEMTIDSATYALRSIKASVPAQTSINYLRQLTIQQTFSENNHLENEQFSMLLDFAIKADSSRIFPTLLITRNTQIHPKNHLPYTTHSPQSDVLSTLHNNQGVSAAMDSLGNTPLFKTAKFFAYVIQTGYIPLQNNIIEIGKINELIKFNQPEGLRAAIPLRTTKNLWKNLSLGGYISYSTKDRVWKGMGQINLALPTERRHTIQLRYGDHYIYSDVDDFHEYIRENNVFNPQVNLITELLRGVPVNKDYYYNTMVRRREGRIYFEDEWNDFLETHTYFKTGRMGYGIPNSNYHAQPSFFYATLGVSARVSFGERKVDSYFHRRYVYNHLPVIYVGAEIGSYQTMTMTNYRMYGNLQLILRHKVDLGMVGKLDYLLQAGMIFGRVPYPLLHIFAGNPSYTLDTQRFSLMNTYQYAADQYISLQALWDGKGVLFNLIPGVRYLRLRELISLKMAYGGMRNNHQSVVPFPSAQQFTHAKDAATYIPLSALTTPYVEVGVGIGNIMRIGELYGVFRITNLQNKYMPWWGIRFRLNLGL